MRKILAVLLTVIATLALSVTPVLAYTAGYLPGGTSIEVDNTEPEDGDVYYIPAGETTIDIMDSGTAAVGEGVAIPDTTLIYVIDASGSTASPSGGSTCGEQQTHDPEDMYEPNQIIDCEILAAKNLNDTAVALGSIDEVAIIMFAGSALVADATPAGGDDAIIHPAADANSNATNDVNEVLQSIIVAEYGGDDSGFGLFTSKATADIYGTNFGAGIQAALDVAATATNPNVIVAFLSDGTCNKGAKVDTFDYGDVVFHTFAIGEDASCSSGALPGGYGSLGDIATLSGGTCTEVEDPSDLPDILPELIVATLESLEMTVDSATVPIDNISPALPQEDPVTVSYSTTIYGLGPGEHEICVTAYASDAGGAGSITDCKAITVVQEVAIDIKPGSYPNSINLKKEKGVIPVAILGSATFDVTTVDVTTLSFGPGGANPAHDLTDPDVYADHLQDVNEDGYIDLVSHYVSSESGIVSDDTSACLSGEYGGGLPFTGCDSVRTLH
ncbi:hypothetical protein ES703_94441 [subsurface metagenome]